MVGRSLEHLPWLGEVRDLARSAVAVVEGHRPQLLLVEDVHSTVTIE